MIRVAIDSTLLIYIYSQVHSSQITQNETLQILYVTVIIIQSSTVSSASSNNNSDR